MDFCLNILFEIATKFVKVSVWYYMEIVSVLGELSKLQGTFV